VISLHHIRKRFRDGERDVEVLHDLLLEVARGEFTAVVGASGSGKSTLLYIAGALDADFEGDAVVAGRTLRDLDARQRAAFRNESVGFVFQSFNLLPALPALENVLLPGLFVPRGVPAPTLSQLRTRAHEALDRVGLADKASRLPGRLSGGERQRVAIARALLSRPAVLLADEPTGNLDDRNASEVLDLLTGLCRENGITIVMMTHDASATERADRVVTLRDGEVEQDLTMKSGPRT
jgi:putative ABC transport system ATP-binding protein